MIHGNSKQNERAKYLLRKLSRVRIWRDKWVDRVHNKEVLIRLKENLQYLI